MNHLSSLWASKRNMEFKRQRSLHQLPHFLYGLQATKRQQVRGENLSNEIVRVYEQARTTNGHDKSFFVCPLTEPRRHETSVCEGLQGGFVTLKRINYARPLQCTVVRGLSRTYRTVRILHVPRSPEFIVVVVVLCLVPKP